MTSPARISPATDGTNATEPGVLRRTLSSSEGAAATGLRKVNLQYRGLPATRAALRVRAFRLEPAAEPL